MTRASSFTAAQMASIRYLAIVAIVAGLPLAGAPWWWPEIVGGHRAWSDAQAREYSQAGVNVHRQTYETSHPLSAEKSAAADRYHRNRQALDQARNAGQTTAAVMQWVGIMTVIAGLLAYSAARRETNPV
jgi:hypothetical protein